MEQQEGTLGGIKLADLGQWYIYAFLAIFALLFSCKVVEIIMKLF